jgi:chlorobactene glucosyltransferase
MQLTVYLILILIVISWIIIYYLAQKDRQYILEPKPTEAIGPNPPLVSIIIPARNEEHSLPECLTSLTILDYPVYEVIVIDDHSTDQTYTVAESFVKKYSNFHILKGKDLPEGWTGKNWANYQGVEVSEGEFLLFTDADTEFFPQAVSSGMTYALEENLDMLSLMPQANMSNFWDKITLPLIGGLIMSWCPYVKVNNPRSAVAGAVGAYILIKRKTYETLGGHATIRGKIVDDREFAVLVKSSGFKLHLLNGIKIYQVRMYDSFKGLWEGWSKNLFLGMNKNYVNACGAITIIFLLMVFPFLAMVWWLISHRGHLGSGLGILSANLIIMWIYMRLQRYFKGNLPAAYGLSLPLGGAIVISLIINSIFRYHRGISWRGRNYLKTSVDV